MPTYRYTAYDLTGTVVQNSVVASSKAEAVEELERSGLMVSKLSESLSRARSGKKLASKDFYRFNREMIALVRAGVPLAEALALLASGDDDTDSLVQILGNVHQQVVGGAAFSEACKKFPEVFDAVYVATVQMGEHSGNLAVSLEGYQAYLSRKMKVETVIKQSLSYPLFLLGALVVVMAILFVVVIPNFSELFDSFDAALPVPTQVVMAIASAAPYGIAASFVAIVMGLFVWRRWDKPLSTYHRLDTLLISTPLIGALRVTTQRARIIRMLGSLVTAGTPLLSAVQITQSAMRENQVGESLSVVADAVESGQSFAQAAAQHNILTSHGIKMLEVGENTGSLAEMLDEIASYYETSLDDRVAQFTALFEPILMTVIGLLIGVVIISMYMPIFFLAEVVQ